MNKKIFQEQFVDLMSSFIYETIKEKAKTKNNIKKSINNFETIWIDMVRENKRNVKRKS
tara:strand:+ start:256 stop:432 length:177 start_codon:yes stop_codon:yes gene_type:complete